MAFVGFEFVCLLGYEVDADGVHVSQSLVVQVVRVDIAQIRPEQVDSVAPRHISSSWLTFRSAAHETRVCRLLLMIDYPLVVDRSRLLRVWEGQGQVADFGLQGGARQNLCIATKRRLSISHSYCSGHIVVFCSFFLFTFVPQSNAADLHLRRLWFL